MSFSSVFAIATMPVLARKRARQRAGDDVEVELERVDLDEPQAGERGERLRRSALSVASPSSDDDLDDRHAALPRA